MALNVSLGTIGEDPRCLTKKPTWSQSGVSCEIYENCSVTSPVLILDYKAEYTSCNYLRINAWNRYYFIERVDLQPGGKAIIYAHCDVLYTYSTTIKSLTCNIERQEGLVEPYLPDNSFTYLDTYDVVSMLPTSRKNGTFLQDATAGSPFFILGILGGANSNLEGISGFNLIITEPADWGTNYMNYFVNVGTIANPQPLIINRAYEDGYLNPNSGTAFNYVSSLYSVYSKA